MNVVIGIREEELDTRTPLTPTYVAKIIELGIRVIVQPSQRRCFSNDDYANVGANVQKDLSTADIIFGVKEIPHEKILSEKIYCFFSHTIKGQKSNMPMLQKILDAKSTLIDYEKITDENGSRLVAFGKYAGYAGMVNALWIYGQRLRYLGYTLPFSSIKQANKHQGLEQAKNAIKLLGQEIKHRGLPFACVCGFTGNGRVASGAKEIFSILPVQEITVEDLDTLAHHSNHHCVYQVSFPLDKIFSHRENKLFCREDYQKSPQNYHSIFSRYLDKLSILVNGIYWDPRYPRLITILDIEKWDGSTAKLQTIADITCDVNGSIEFNVRSTNSDNPCYVYNPTTHIAVDGWEGEGLTVLAMDKLPGAIPKESSEGFSGQLYHLLHPFLKENKQQNPPSWWENAMIVNKGNLTESYKYLQQYLG